MCDSDHVTLHEKALKDLIDFPVSKQVWTALAVLYAALVLHLAYYLQTPGRTCSLSLKLLALAVISSALAVFATTLRWPRLQAVLTRAGQHEWLSGLVVAGGLAALFVLGMLMRPEWFYAQLAFTLAATLAVITNAIPLRLPRLSQRTQIGILGAMVVVIVLIRLRSLAYYPSIHPIDEGWDLGWALSFVRTGHLSDWIMVDRDYSINRYYMLVGGWLKLFGVGLWQARAFSFLLVHVVIVLTALTAKNLYGKRTAWFTAAALFSSVILMSGGRLRHDIGLTVSIAVALWLWSETKIRRKSILHLAAGLALGSGLASHYHAPFFGVALAAAFFGPSLVLHREHRQRTLGDLVLFVAGGFAAAALIIAVQPIPTGGPGHYIHAHTVGEWLDAVRQHVANISHFSQYEFVLIALGVGAALRRRREGDVVIVCAAVFAHLVLAIASSGRLFEYYLVPVTPFYGLLVGSFFGKGVGRVFGQRPAVTNFAAIAVCTVFLIVNLGTTLRVPVAQLYRGSPLEPTPTAPAQWVLDNIPPGSSVVGEHLHYLWLTNYRYVSPLAPNLMRPSRRSQFDTLPAVWEDINPDVFMVDEAGSTYPLLSPLVDDAYFERNGYVEAVRFESTRIYTRDP